MLIVFNLNNYPVETHSQIHHTKREGAKETRAGHMAHGGFPW